MPDTDFCINFKLGLGMKLGRACPAKENQELDDE